MTMTTVLADNAIAANVPSTVYKDMDVHKIRRPQLIEPEPKWLRILGNADGDGDGDVFLFFPACRCGAAP